MSQAKVHRAAKARKEWRCGKCGTTVKVGEPVLSFSVGYRGIEQRRCDKPECYPTRSERESSLVASVYDVIDNLDWPGAESLEDIQALVQEAADAFTKAANEYEQSEMFDKNPDLQERAETLTSSASDIESWSFNETEPTEEDPGSWESYKTFDEAHEVWLQQARDEAQQTVDEAEIP